MTMDPAELNVEGTCKRIGVISALAGADHGSAQRSRPQTPGSPDLGQQRVLAALETVFQVRFEATDPTDLNGFDGVLVLGPPSLANTQAALPQLVLPRADGRDSHMQACAVDGHVASGKTNRVLMSRAPGLARPLRGQAIEDSAIPGKLPLPPAGSSVLASLQDKPIWWQLGDTGASLGVSAYPLAGLHDGEALRDHLRVGRFMGLLPIVHFLGQVLGAGEWTAPPLQACFVVDDPNLHWLSYGFLNYRELAEHAERHGYHVALATIPIDSWLTDRRVVSLLGENARTLSLLIHGNDHVARELGRLNGDAQAQSVIAQALRRVEKLERRHGVTVDRVMIPPHEACSEAALRAMFALGVEAVSVAPPYPWRDGMLTSTPLATWHPAELVAGGLRVLPRQHLHAPREELALRALLGQPLILYGHHDDFAEGLDVLAHAAVQIDALGDVRWCSLGEIARGGYATKQLRDLLLIRMHARRIAVDVPTGVCTLRVLIQEPLGGTGGHHLAHAQGLAEITFRDGWGVSEPFAINSPGRIDLELIADTPRSPAEVPSPRVRLWPWVRRVLSEGQDRVQALR